MTPEDYTTVAALVRAHPDDQDACWAALKAALPQAPEAWLRTVAQTFLGGDRCDLDRPRRSG